MGNAAAPVTFEIPTHAINAVPRRTFLIRHTRLIVRLQILAYPIEAVLGRALLIRHTRFARTLGLRSHEWRQKRERERTDANFPTLAAFHLHLRDPLTARSSHEIETAATVAREKPRVCDARIDPVVALRVEGHLGQVHAISQRGLVFSGSRPPPTAADRGATAS